MAEDLEYTGPFTINIPEDSGATSIKFTLADGSEPLLITAKGEFFVNGHYVTDDLKIYEALAEWVGALYGGGVSVTMERDEAVAHANKLEARFGNACVALRGIISQIEHDERHHYPPANVMVNAPLALEQVAMSTRRATAEKILAILEED